jgi:hypothetical protein
MLVAITALEKVQHLLLRDEVLSAQPRNPQHFEQKQIALHLLFFQSLVRQRDLPREERKSVHHKAAVKNVPRRDQLDTVDGVIMFGVRVRSEENLDDLEQEEELGHEEDHRNHLVAVVSERHDVQIK